MVFSKDCPVAGMAGNLTAQRRLISAHTTGRLTKNQHPTINPHCTTTASQLTMAGGRNAKKSNEAEKEKEALQQRVKEEVSKQLDEKEEEWEEQYEELKEQVTEVRQMTDQQAIKKLVKETLNEMFEEKAKECAQVFRKEMEAEINNKMQRSCSTVHNGATGGFASPEAIERDQNALNNIEL